MHIRPGILIRSTEALEGSSFEGAVIFISQYNLKGAMGFVINRTFGKSLNDLDEFRNSISVPLFEGGPVDKEHLFFVHSRPDIIEEGELVANGIYVGGNFEQTVKAINKRIMSMDHIKIFIGYCGWDAGELEAEIEEGSWILIEGANDIVFKNP
jgi:putative transcriptional regulator